MNRALTTALAGVAAGQLLKVPVHYWKTRTWEWSMAVEPGGMPSSHSAGVSSLATYTAMKKGFGSIEFAISALYGLVVMYDAMGIRRRAGEIAMEVNELDQRVEELEQDRPGPYHEKQQALLEEKLGHMPMEVLGGMLLGAAIGAASFFSELTTGVRKERFSFRR
ncbi:divergent PAP2 family protein [Gorillibacterium sp. sgz5001074]|uniref:divergent PAP2 family protein n=1 Tax=Gorillibacterium sp. sgz5001074 TaxID=3446695 RepID=UPI003F671E2B